MSKEKKYEFKSVTDQLFFNAKVRSFLATCEAFLTTIPGRYRFEGSILVNDLVFEARGQAAIKPVYEEAFKEGMILLHEMLKDITTKAPENFVLCIKLEGHLRAGNKMKHCYGYQDK